MAQLEREGFVRSVPRRGVYVVRKTKREVIELITAWAALESMAARLITENASDDEIASLRRVFAAFDNGSSARISTNIPKPISNFIRRWSGFPVTACWSSLPRTCSRICG